MRRTLQLMFVWFFAVTAGISWAGADMGTQPPEGIVLLAASN